jgi:hypothetical protein
MKTLTFNKNSFHYKLAGFGNEWFDAKEDICGYTRQVFFGLIQLILCIGIGAFLVAGFGRLLIETILGIIFFVMYALPLDGVAIVGCVCYGAMIALVAAGYIYHITKSWRKARKPCDNFVTHAYASFKGKYCATIEFVRE